MIAFASQCESISAAEFVLGPSRCQTRSPELVAVAVAAAVLSAVAVAVAVTSIDGLDVDVGVRR